jgi:uncharacterized repeat protein (TIGR03803 family)
MHKTSIMLAASALFLILPGVRVHAQTFTTLYTFTGGSDGGEPSAGMIFDSLGNLYGLTQGNATGFGTVFEMSPSSGGGMTLNTLYTFQGGADGVSPEGSLVFDTAGNLYGTTVQGGSNACNFGCGTVFELSPNGSSGWQKTEIYQFHGGTDGENPASGVVIDGAGNLYGATEFGGGPCSNIAPGCGTVFELSPVTGGWTETVLHRFGTGHVNNTGFSTPAGGIVRDASGNLYGTVAYGGLSGCGGAFELSSGTGGWSLQLLHAFKCGSDGAYPQGTLVFDGTGHIYGTTVGGGAFKDGTVYVLTPRPGKGWESRIIHNFKGADGWAPFAGITLDAAGNVYGTTGYGGGSKNCANGCGVAYELTATSSSSWTYSTLHVFTLTDGRAPSSLVLDGAGDLFGITVLGGADNVGTVFEITPN